MGALVSKAQLDKVERLHRGRPRARARRSRAAARGPRDAHLANGYFMPPTVFTDVTQSMRIASEEIFGPVLCVLTWTDEARCSPTSTPSSTA